MSIDEVMDAATEYRIAPTFAGRCEAKSALRTAIKQHVAEAVKAEREACAKVAEVETYLSRVSLSSVLGDDAVSHCHVAAAIRARAEKEKS